MKILIGNKRYSSWSLRPWLVLRHFNIPFEEHLIPLGQGDISEQVRSFACASAGKVPCIIDDSRDLAVWDSLAIIEYLADQNQHLTIWPIDLAARAHARSASSEMHSGFATLRKECPMNLGKRYAPRDRGEGVNEDVKRITSIWRAAREWFGAQTDSPFLYGDFTAADAMFAPVVTRFHTYSIEVDSVSQAYMDAVMALPAFQEWRNAALLEDMIIARSEFDEPILETYAKI